MSRYIDADALKAFIRNRYFQCDMPEEWGNGVMWATSQINYYCNKEAPSIDIEPKRGEWIEQEDCWQCSVCGDEYVLEVGVKPIDAKMNFCPNCGADMREREGE